MSEIIDMLITNLFARDPCRKCIVRACCSQTCDKSRKFLRHMGNDVTISRVAAWQLVITIFIVVPWMILSMFMFN